MGPKSDVGPLLQAEDLFENLTIMLPLAFIGALAANHKLKDINIETPPPAVASFDPSGDPMAATLTQSALPPMRANAATKEDLDKFITLEEKLEYIDNLVKAREQK